MQKIDPNIPLGLYTLQKWFGNVITEPITEWDDKGIPTIDNDKYLLDAQKLITPSSSLRSDQRIGIYKMQYWLRLFELLKDDFPFVLRLFGNEAFEEKIATPYLLNYPSNTWELNLLGYMLPKWIKDNYSEVDKNLIYHASLIDYMYTEVFYTPDYPFSLEIDAKTILKLQPFVKLFELNANLFQFREKFLKKDANYWLENPFPKLAKSKKFYFVLYRSYNKVKYSKISYGEYLLLKAFEVGSNIEDAFKSFPKRYMKNANIELWFSNWSKNNWLMKKE